MQELAVEREALEEVREEAVAAQEEADRLEQLIVERDQASKKHADELAAREEQLALREQEVASREDTVDKGEENMRSAQTDLRRQADDLERDRVDVLRREEQAIEAQAEQLERAHTEVAAQLQEARVVKDIPASTTSGKGLEARLKKAEEDLDAVYKEQTNVKAMMQDVIRQARDSVEAAGLMSVSVGSQGLDTLGHLALGLLEITRRLEALPAAV
ncbi:uncharacterized protein LOC133891239 [Phragmites australis]|uniref:uncharacterized protein LOC133891239 n=1 Tax=Phragmites australis TaxID=29695 RepID=UPI002D77D0A6|nr:uncharacterized protein LOC133891239 [Phragmites australis]